MRYGVEPRRQIVQVNLPSVAYDSQIDTYWVFRFGGSVLSWRFIGSTASTNTVFQDNYDDDAANAGDAIQFDNFEPWPSIDFPLVATATQIAGFIAVVTIPAPTNALRFLPVCGEFVPHQFAHARALAGRGPHAAPEQVQEYITVTGE